MSLTKVSYSMLGAGNELSPDDFGATGGANDTVAVQAAFDSGKPIIFTRDYYVDSVSIRSTAQTIDFNGFSLIGIRLASATTAAAVLSINATYLKLYNVSVNANFKNYIAGIQMYSDVNSTSQWCKIYGVFISNVVLGFVYGSAPGTAGYNAPQSENVIYSLTTRGTQVPFVGNASINGYLTLVGAVLDCNPYEWASQPGYDATDWHTNAYCMRQLDGNLFMSGGELLKTTTQLGYGIEAKNTVLSGVTMEIACKQGLVRGNITLRDIQNCYQAGDLTAWEISSDADGLVAGDGARLLFENCNIWRANNVWSYSGSRFVTGSPTETAYVEFKSSTMRNWLIGQLANTTNVIFITDGLRIATFDNSNVLVLRDTSNKNTSVSQTVQGVGVDVPYAIRAIEGIIHISHNAGIPAQATLQTIYAPYPGWTGNTTLIPDTAVPIGNLGNIKTAGTCVVGKPIVMTYDGTFWYPSY